MPRMATRRINQYIFREIFTPTLLGLVVFTFILIMGRLPGLTEMVVNKGVPLSSILKLFGYLLPTFLSITVPLSFLLGILLAFGRLSADSEFIALKSTGISLYSLLMPVLFIASICVVITGGLTLYGEPLGKSAFRDQVFSIATDKANVGILGGVFNDSFDNLILYAETMNDATEEMLNVFISDERSAKEPSNIFARKGRFIHNEEQQTLTLRLNQGTIHHLASGDQDSYQTIGFDTYDINLDLNKSLSNAASRSISLGEYSPNQLIAERNNSTDSRQRNRFATELHKRISTSAAPLVFALIGIPLGLQSNRSGKGAGFALALGIALCYYILLNLSGTLANKGIFPASIILYLPNLLFFSTGIFFIHRSAIEKPIKLPRLQFKRLFSSSAGEKK
jgi:lipopolysaccharide export system permease protein